MENNGLTEREIDDAIGDRESWILPPMGHRPNDTEAITPEQAREQWSEVAPEVEYPQPTARNLFIAAVVIVASIAAGVLTHGGQS